MGRDLLAEDYMLKQMTAILIYPERKLGKTFWDQVYTKTGQLYGTAQVPVNTLIRFGSSLTKQMCLNEAMWPMWWELI